MSIASNISDRIQELYNGKVFITASLLDLGSRTAVDQTLRRMVSKKEIRRLAPGIFISQPDGEPAVTPSSDQIVAAIAEQEGIKVQISSAEAAFRLGLSLIMPAWPVYESTGLNRKIKVDGYTIYLKSVSAKKLLLAGSDAGLALSALSHLGKGEVNEKVLYKIEKRIGKDEYIKMINARSSMPGWLARDINNILKNKADNHELYK